MCLCVCVCGNASELLQQKARLCGNAFELLDTFIIKAYLCLSVCVGTLFEHPSVIMLIRKSMHTQFIEIGQLKFPFDCRVRV